MQKPSTTHAILASVAQLGGLANVQHVTKLRMNFALYISHINIRHTTTAIVFLDSTPPHVLYSII